MKLATLKNYLFNKPFAMEDYPFGPEPMVAKVFGKMFAIVSCDENALKISLKCDPTDAQILRSIHKAIKPGYHLNKEHWNTVTLDGSLAEEFIFQLIDESYLLVVSGLKKANRNRILEILNKGENH